MSSKKHPANYKGGTSARFMIRVDPKLRAEWQREADQLAGVKGAELGPWIRNMVQIARGRG